MKLQPKPAYVCSIPGVAQERDRIYMLARVPPVGVFVDLQADLLDDVGAENMLKLADTCLRLAIPNDNGDMTSGFFTLQAFYELRASHQLCARHDELREEKLCHMFTKLIKKAGPAGNMRIINNISRGGKTNKNGHVVIQGCIRTT